MEATDLPKGLTLGEVQSRIDAQQTNDTHEQASRSVKDILRANVLTRLNAIVAVMTTVVLIVGSPIDASFGIAAVLNSIIGIFQELRAKRTLDRLAILHAPVATVVRNSQVQTIPAKDMVLDDVVRLQSGDQISVDGVVISAEGLEANESLLTGEVDSVIKEPQGKLLAGSFIVAGHGYMRATAVGTNTYVHSITKQAKRFTIARSELVEGTNKLLKYITWIILAVAPFIIFGQIVWSDVEWREALVRSMAALDGMIPQGLVLLTSLAFMLATLALARRKVLIQQLPAVEGLARVDTICLDKTGTLTEGTIAFDELIALDKTNADTTKDVLAAFATDPNSPTLHALHEAFPKTTQSASYVVPFSSARKWSAITTGKKDYWIIGAPEMVWRKEKDTVRVQANEIAATGKRVLLLARASSKPTTKQLPANLQAVALIVLSEKIRSDAQATLAYFTKQNVALKVISGDSPQTVRAIAQKVGIAGEAIDARTLPDDIHKLAELLDTHSVFGRVMPSQKQAMVRALQSKGHVVAMTGDGVNDALALKDADIGIAMGNGAQATKAIAELVLLDNKFSRMPRVLAEGRRVIANIERVASLFIVKNVYSLLLAVAVTALAMSYPFLPRHLTILSALTIGIPAFFLSLAPNNRRYISGYLKRVLHFSIPAGTIIAVLLFVNYLMVSSKNGSPEDAGTTSSVIVMSVAMWVIVCLARPLKAWKILLVASLYSTFAVLLATTFTRELAEFSLTSNFIWWSLLCSAIGIVSIETLWRFSALKRARTDTEPAQVS